MAHAPGGPPGHCALSTAESNTRTFAQLSRHSVDERVMQRGILVGVVRGLGLEDDVQRDVELQVIDRPAQPLFARAACEEDDPGVSDQVFLAGRDEVLDRGLGTILQREVNIVSEHRAVISRS